MRYTFLLYSDPAEQHEPTPEQAAEELAAYGAYIQALQEAGVLVHTDWLAPEATTVSLVDGQPVVQDGAFVDTREELGGEFVVDVPDLEAALDWAKRCPALYGGKIVVRASAMPAGEA
ncbi:hypothetical protein USB125703_01723 [Pseudoclavibacter triregionum]|nr:hypothetical protein USB125703_01723 [Pseudoclavibacter triregionum]